MPRREIEAYLHDILDAIERIHAHVEGLPDAQSYAHHPLVRDGVERCFQIIGEGLMKLRDHDTMRFEQVRDAHAIIGFRHILVHEYFDLDPSRVWSFIHDGDLETLRTDVQRLA